MALHGTADADRAWALASSWQNPDGGWRPAADVELSHAATALSVSMAIARGDTSERFQNGVKWLVGTSGIETDFAKRAILRVGTILGMVEDQRDYSLKGWPWKPNTASWVEPTSHAVVALKQAASRISGNNELRERVRLGEAQLMDVRCKDGGWNYGNKTARGDDLRSYPETTGIALVGLQGRSDLGSSFDLAKKLLAETTLPMGRAWLTIALRLNGIDAPELRGDPSPDVLVTALEALSAPEGNHALMKVPA